MKKLIKIILKVVASLFILYVLAALLVSPISKWYIESHSKELVGRTVKMDDLDINLFTGHLNMENMVMYESDNTTSFFSIHNFETNLDLFSLLKKRIKLDYLYFTGLNLQILQNGESYNFDDIIAHFSSSDTLANQVKEEKRSSWGIILNDIQIQRSNVFYKDLLVGSDWGSKDFSLVIPGIDLSEMEADMGVQFNFTNGGALSMQMNYAQDSQTYILNVIMDNFALSGLLPYVQQQINIEELAGLVDVNLQIKGNTQHVMAVDINGTMDVSQFAMGTFENPIALCDSIHVEINDIDIDNQQYMFDTLLIYGLKGKVENFADKTSNISRMWVAETTTDSLEKESAPSESVVKMNIANISLRNGRFDYVDHSLPSKFEYQISDIKMDALNFNPDSINNIRLSAILQKTGTLRAVWTGNMENAKNQNIMVDLKNISMSDFTPYSLSYFGYPISEGTLSLSSQNIVSNYKLTGINKLEIANPELKEKAQDVDPEYNIPLKLGLYLLTDKNRKINLDLPVSGSVDSPSFSYKKLIIKTLENVLLKVIASPFSIVSGLILGEEDLQYIALEPCQVDFTLDQYAQFDKIAALLLDKPDVRIKLEQRLNYKEAMSEMAGWSLKRAYYLSQNPGKESVMPDLFDREALKEISLKDAQVVAFADSLLAARSLVVEGNVEAKALALYSENAISAMQRIMQRRNQTLQKYMLEQKNVPAAQLEVKSMSWDMIQRNEGKNLYNIELTMQESEPQKEEEE